MLTMADIEKLERFDTRGARVLSVFLHLDPPRHIRRAYVTAFDDLVKEAREHLEDPLRSQLRREAATVRVWLENGATAGQSAGAFRLQRPRADDRAWRCPFASTIISRLTKLSTWRHCSKYWTNTSCTPWPSSTSSAPGCLPSSRERSRRALSLQTTFRADTHREVLAQPRYQRHHDAHVNWHLKRVIRHLQSLHRSQRFDRLIIAGPKEATSELRRLLNATLAHRLAAVIPAAIDASPTEVLAQDTGYRAAD